MAQTEFTGRLAEVTFDPGAGAKTLLGLLNGTITETGKGAVEQLDATVVEDSAYTFLPDPLGQRARRRQPSSSPCRIRRKRWTTPCRRPSR